MPRAFLILLAILAICGCAPDKRAIGSWSYDPATLKLNKGAAPVQDQVLAAKFKSLRLLLNADGTFKVEGGLAKQEGTWRMESGRVHLESEGTTFPELTIIDKNNLRQPVETVQGPGSVQLVRKVG